MENDLIGITQNPMASMEEIERRLAAAPDAGFRGRVLHEYRSVAKVTKPYLSLGGARILDFGCGAGIAIASFALRLPNATLFGIDIRPPNKKALQRKFREQVGLDLPASLTLASSEPGTLPNEISDMDLIYAWSVFEHVSFPELVNTMRMVRQRLRRGGVFFLQINPLYFSPKGSHLYRYDPSPWMHLIHQTDELKAIVMSADVPEVMKTREWQQFETLNRATADDIVSAGLEAGFSVIFEERLRASITPPTRLGRAYNSDALVTEEIRLLLRAAAGADQAGPGAS